MEPFWSVIKETGDTKLYHNEMTQPNKGFWENLKTKKPDTRAGQTGISFSGTVSNISPLVTFTRSSAIFAADTGAGKQSVACFFLLFQCESSWKRTQGGPDAKWEYPPTDHHMSGVISTKRETLAWNKKAMSAGSSKKLPPKSTSTPCLCRLSSVRC